MVATRLTDSLDTARAVLLCWRARLSARQVGVALVYHRVGGDRKGDTSREILATVPRGAFSRQLRHFRRHYRIVRAAEIHDAARRRRRGQRFPACITFDDDLASHATDAFPALREANVTATFFLGGASLERPHSYWWQDLQSAVDENLLTAGSLPPLAEEDVRAALVREPKAIFRVAATIERLEPIQREATAQALRAIVGERHSDAGLRAEDVRMLVRGGCDIGFHTLRHETLPLLDNDALREALRDGRKQLEDVSDRCLDMISYPHGHADERVAEAARAAGFNSGFVTGRRAVTGETHPLLVPRIPPAPFPGKTALRVARAVASSNAP